MNHDAEQIREFYRQFIKPSDLVFDVGANVGDRTRIFAQLAREVVAVEPQIGLLDSLKTHPRVHVIEKACGAKPGIDMQMISPATTISSMSHGWVQAVAKTKRFELGNWTSTEIVPVTTLDALIGQFGCPDFCKIDVEGYESDVLIGLSTQVKALSFEFTPEYLESAMQCCDLLTHLGNYEFNYDLNESFQLSDTWRTGTTILAILDQINKQNGEVFGDIYARLR